MKDPISLWNIKFLERSIMLSIKIVVHEPKIGHINLRLSLAALLAQGSWGNFTRSFGPDNNPPSNWPTIGLKGGVKTVFNANLDKKSCLNFNEFVSRQRGPL